LTDEPRQEALEEVTVAGSESRSVAGPRPGERVVILVAGLGMFLSTLDTGIITVALPTLRSQLHASTSEVAWAVTAYVVALAASVVVFGRLADRVGRVRVAAAGFVAFALASIVSAMAPTIGVLIVGRVCQGIAAAMLQATSQALITTLLPENRRGPALGTLGMLIGVGPVAGPTVGGVLLSFASWPFLFWINLPLCGAALLAFRRLHDEPTSARQRPSSYDLGGSGLLAAGATALLVTITFASKYPASSVLVLGPAIATVAVITLLVAWERRSRDPVLRPEWFSSASTRSGLFTAGVFGATSAIVFVVPPFILEHQLGLLDWQVGLIAALAPAGLVLASRVSGSRISRIGPWALMTTGMIVMVGALALLTVTAGLLSLPIIGVLLFVYGIGGGLFQPANIAAVMAAAGRGRQGTIGAAQRLVLNIGIGIGTTVSTALLPVLAGGGASWGAAGGLSAIGVLTLQTSRRRRHTAHS